MDSVVTKIADVDPMLDDIKVLARCISIFKCHPVGNPRVVWSLNFVMQDPEGNRMEAKIKPEFISKFQGLLDEGKCYIFGDFSVGNNSGKFPLLNHPFKLNFYKNTTVKRVGDFDNNIHGFKFTPFPAFTAREYPETELVDVIGTVISISDSIPFNKKGKNQTRRTIILEDVEGAQLECCFFDEWDHKFAKLFDERASMGHVVMILQLCKSKYFKQLEDVTKHSVTNAMYSTKFYINEDLPEIAAFKKRYVQKDGYDPKNSIAQYTPVKKELTAEEFFKGAIKKTVGGIRDSDKPFECIMYAKIHKIHKEHGWTYLACKQCGRSAKEVEVGESSSSANRGMTTKLWNCFKHPALKEGAVGMRYKVIIRVIDDTGSASLLLFDDMVYKLCGATCYDVITKNGTNYDDYFPAELDNMKGKQLLFRFKYKSEHIDGNKHVYQIASISDDEDMIKQFKKGFIQEDDELIDDMHTPLLANGKSLKVNLSDIVPFSLESTPTAVESSSKHILSYGNGVTKSNSNESYGVSDGSSGSGKRVIIDLDDYDEEEANAKRVKSLVRVKIEKDD